MLEPVFIAGYVIAGLLFLSALFLTVCWNRVTRWFKAIKPLPSHSHPEPPETAAKENYRLTDSVLVLKEIVSGYAINRFSDSWIDFGFEVFNTAKSVLRIGYRVEGNIIFQGNPLFDRPVPLAPADIPGGGRAMITIRQRLLPANATVIMQGSQKEEGIKIQLDFRNLQIKIQEGDHSSQNQPEGVLPLTRVRTYRVIQNRRLSGFYIWERLDDKAAIRDRLSVLK